MATLTYNGESYTVDHAAKGVNYIHGYDANGVLIVAFDGVADFSGFTYDGDYMDPSDCLTEHCNIVVYCGNVLRKRNGEPVMPNYFVDVDFSMTMANPDGEYSTEETVESLTDALNAGMYLVARVNIKAVAGSVAYYPLSYSFYSNVLSKYTSLRFSYGGRVLELTENDSGGFDVAISTEE